MSADVDQDSIKMDSFAHLAQMDVLVAPDPTSASSADLEDLPTTVSVITVVLQDQ